MTNIILTSDLTLFAVRVGLAVLCGALLGIERQWRGRQAGLRTNLLVCVGSAVFTYLSATAFRPTGDTARVAAQIVSGIGFLGAGVMLRRGESVQGLNTAATLWAAAAVGMAAGAGAMVVALEATGALLAVQILFRPVALLVDRHSLHREARYRYWLTVQAEVRAVRDVQDFLLPAFSDLGVHRVSTALRSAEEGVLVMEFVLASPERVVTALEPVLTEVLRVAGVRDLVWRSEIESPSTRRPQGRFKFGSPVLPSEGGTNSSRPVDGAPLANAGVEH